MRIFGIDRSIGDPPRTPQMAGTPTPELATDLNGDGTVNVIDIAHRRSIASVLRKKMIFWKSSSEN